jgi:hypothetical protein
MIQYWKFPPSKASNVSSSTWIGAVLFGRFLAVTGLNVLQFIHCNEWWKYFTNGSIGLLQELRWGMTRWNVYRCRVLRLSHQSHNLKASGETSLGVAIILCTFQSLITVKFRAKWTLGEGRQKLWSKTRRWVVPWHVVWFGWNWEPCLLPARIFDCMCFMLDLCFCFMPIPWKELNHVKLNCQLTVTEEIVVIVIQESVFQCFNTILSQHPIEHTYCPASSFSSYRICVAALL